MRLLQLICRKDKYDDDAEKPLKKTDDKSQLIIPMDDSGHLDFDELLDSMTSRYKVRYAAILDAEGNILNTTPDWAPLQDDGHKISQVMSVAATRALWQMSVFGEDFQCFQCDAQQTVLGYSKTSVLTAHRTRSHVVLGLAPRGGPGSCLYEVKQAWIHMEERGL